MCCCFFFVIIKLFCFAFYVFLFVCRFFFFHYVLFFIFLFAIPSSFFSDFYLVFFDVSYSVLANIDISEDLSMIGAFFGLILSMMVYINQQTKIAQLIKDMSYLGKFGKPQFSDDLRKNMNLTSKIFFNYATYGTVAFNGLKILEIANCKKHKEDIEICGVVIPVYLPVTNFAEKIIFGVLILYLTIIVDRTASQMSAQILELTFTLRLKIRHLTFLIQNCFEGDEDNIGEKLGKCVAYHQVIIE